MLAEDERLHLGGRELEFLGDERAEARGVQHGAQAIDLLPRQAQSLHGQARENIDRVRDDEDVGVLAQAGGLDALENLREQRDVAIDEVEARFVGLAAQAGGDEKKIAVRGPGVIAGVNLLVTGEGAAVEQVQRFAFGHFFIGVEDLDLRDQPAALQGERGARPDPPAPADYGDFHKFKSCSATDETRRGSGATTPSPRQRAGVRTGVPLTRRSAVIAGQTG